MNPDICNAAFMINEKYKHSELTGKIIGCAMKVHRTLGNGFPEVIYQRCLEIEMAARGRRFSRELEMAIYYEGITVGKRKVDFLVEDIIMVEFKAVSFLDDNNLAQALNYLELLNWKPGFK